MQNKAVERSMSMCAPIALSRSAGALIALQEVLSKAAGHLTLVHEHLPVIVRLEVSGEPLDPQDEDVPGAYLIEVDSRIPLTLLGPAAFEAFNAVHPVQRMQDFSFAVIHEGVEIAHELVLETGPDELAEIAHHGMVLSKVIA